MLHHHLTPHLNPSEGYQDYIHPGRNLHSITSTGKAYIGEALFDRVWKQLQLVYLLVGRNQKCYARLIYESKVSEVSHQVVVQCKKCYQTTDARPCLMPLIVKRQLWKQQNDPYPSTLFFVAGLATQMGSQSMLLAPEAAGRFSYSVGTGCEFWSLPIGFFESLH